MDNTISTTFKNNNNIITIRKTKNTKKKNVITIKGGKLVTSSPAY